MRGESILMLQSKDNSSADISENIIREKMPNILDILLIDRTTSTKKKTKNIIWANENYIKYGRKYFSDSQITPELITGQMGYVVKPRALKSRELQKERTKLKAEVFTPVWVVKRQNDEVERDFLNDDLETYVKRMWIEVSCGEAPYMATRYEMETGELVPLVRREGFIDRKLKRINEQVSERERWQSLVEEAYKSSYGFEWNGDSLFIARENLLYTYRDYYLVKWSEEPEYSFFEKIAKIISYNVFQMDGLKYIVPMTDKQEDAQLSLFSDDCSRSVKSGKRVKVMDWEKNKMVYFDKGVVNNGHNYE